MALTALQFRSSASYRANILRNFTIFLPSTAQIYNESRVPAKQWNCNRHELLKTPHSIYNQRIVSRSFSTESPNISTPPKRSLPQLMSFPEIVWPSVFKSIKNWILVNFIIRPYFDREFNMPDFVAGAKQALQIVSTKLAEGEIAVLNGLVDREILNELKASVSKMSVAQRNELRINREDIYLSFPYQVGIMFDESNEKIQKRWVEITMVFHVLRGLSEMQERGETPPLNLGLMPEYRDKVSICNYRFIKEFTQGCESDWTVNVANHFKPQDFVNE